MKVVIIGGVAGGASAAARLRRLDEQAEIIMVERGEYISFANCGLPYYIGGEIAERKNLLLQTPAAFKARFNVDVRNFSEAIAISRANKTVAIKNLQNGKVYEETYDKLILSTGAKPLELNIPGQNSNGVFTVKDIPDADSIKAYITRHKAQSALIVGGGFIGLEMADNLKAAGLHVIITELSDHILATLDFDMAKHAEAYLESQGINLKLQNSIKSISPEAETNQLTITLESGDIVSVDLVILCAGVRPESQIAIACGLETNPKGSIIVTDALETSDPDIYAVGDVIQVKNFITGMAGYVPLAGPANKQGRIAADNICGLNRTFKGVQGSAIIKLGELSAASTGLNESACKMANLDYEKVYVYAPSHAKYYPGGRFMFLKTIFENKTGKILGAQIVGFEGVDKRIDIYATAIRAGFSAYDLAELELSYAPPFSSAKDPVNMAGFVIENLLDGKVKNFHWHDIAGLANNPGVTKLDVRTRPETERGMIEGFIHIPLDELRGRLDEIPQGKPVYICCQSGQRSYIACRMLSAYGYNCYNLSGGYLFYNIVTNQINKNCCCLNQANKNSLFACTFCVFVAKGQNRCRFCPVKASV